MVCTESESAGHLLCCRGPLVDGGQCGKGERCGSEDGKRVLWQDVHTVDLCCLRVIVGHRLRPRFWCWLARTAGCTSSLQCVL